MDLDYLDQLNKKIITEFGLFTWSSFLFGAEQGGHHNDF